MTPLPSELRNIKNVVVWMQQSLDLYQYVEVLNHGVPQYGFQSIGKKSNYPCIDTFVSVVFTV